MQGKSDSLAWSFCGLETDGTRPQTLLELVGRRAALSPDTPALIAADGERLTYVALYEHMVETGRALRAAGIRRTDAVATVMGGGPESAATFLAIAAACVCAPLNPTYRAQELEFYLGDLGARLIVVPAGSDTEARAVASARGIEVADVAPGADSLVHRLDLQPSNGFLAESELANHADDALVLHTSGTTARPKIVPLTHGRLTTSAMSIAATLDLGESDRCLNPMPLFHIHGLVAGLLAPLVAGGSVICPPAFEAAQFLDWLETLEPTWFTAVPTMHQAVLARLRDRSRPSCDHTLRFVRSSSAPLPVPVSDGLERELGVPVIEAYGMTEAAHQIASNPLPPGRRVPGTVGVAAGPEIAILDEEGDELAVGDVGEVAIRGGNVFAGYADDPEANASAFVRGWFRTGDLGLLHEDGYLELRGRIKEIINRGGEKIAPGEIDDLLLRHPAVAQSVTFGVPDVRLGEDVAAAVVLLEGHQADERELQYFVAQTLAPFKVPRRIMVVDEIPKGATGKVQRIGMHQRLGISGAEGASVSGYVPPRSHLEAELVRIWADVLGADRVGTTDDFFALGGDSLLGSEAVARIRDLIGRPELPLISIVRAPTPARMVEEILAEEDGDETVLELRRGGTATPIFITHGGDLVVGLPAIARRLDGKRPVYGLRPSLHAAPAESLTFGRIAAELVAAALSVQPQGPYILAGICSGGPVVLEMARLLQGADAEIELLILIDPRVSQRRRVRYLVRRFAQHSRRGSLRSAAAQTLRRAASGRLPSVSGQSDFYRRLATARDAYAPAALTDVPAAVITARDYDSHFAIPFSVWRNALPDGFVARSIEFDHEEMMFPPAIDALVAVIDDLMDAHHG